LLSKSSLLQIGTQDINWQIEPFFNQNSGVANALKDMAHVIVELRLDKHNAKEWYVTAARGMDTVEVAYLDGLDSLYPEQQEGFMVDGIAWKVRIDAGIAPLDYRALVKSMGKPPLRRPARPGPPGGSAYHEAAGTRKTAGSGFYSHHHLIIS